MQRKDQPDMFFGAKPAIFEKAKFLRENMTLAEKLLWDKLKNSQLGVRFKAQHPIDIFIADFYCYHCRLVIEIDGDIHKEQKDYDEGRTAELEQFGITVIRFKNSDVLNDIENVLIQINELISLNITTPKSPLGDLGVKKHG